MRFDYQYRTRANELKFGSLSASSRDDAFRQLKARGINPSRVVLSSGALNRLASLGKRGWAIVVLTLSLFSAVIGIVLQKRDVPVRAPEMRTVSDIDPEVLKRLESSGLNVDAINELLEARRKVNDEYRRKIESEVESGKLSRSAADELFRTMGL